MNDINDDFLRVEPVKSYTPPNLPTQEEANLAQLKKLPSRWQKNAAVIACMSFVGAVTLSGFSYAVDYANRPHQDTAVYAQSQQREEQSEQNGQIEPTQLQAAIAAAELDIRIHIGGRAFVPFYVVHITEQEALAIIRAKLETAGLNFGTTPPDNTVSTGWQSAGIDLYDEEKGVAISQISWEINSMGFGASPLGDGHLAERTAREFSQQLEDTTVGVFFNPGKRFGMSYTLQELWQTDEFRGRIGELADQSITDHERNLREEGFATPEAAAEAKEILIDRLLTQVQTFIDFLQEEGIL